MLKKMPTYKRAIRGRPRKYPHLEKKIKDWVLENMQEGIIVTPKAIRFHALQESRKLGICEFMASEGWCTRFMNRNNLVLMKKTTTTTSRFFSLFSKGRYIFFSL